MHEDADRLFLQMRIVNLKRTHAETPEPQRALCKALIGEAERELEDLTASRQNLQVAGTPVNLSMLGGCREAN
jgi:hypothetical protein